MRVNGKFSLYPYRTTRCLRLARAGMTVMALVISPCLPITPASSYYRADELPAIASEPKPSLTAASGERAVIDALARMPMRFEACGSNTPARYLARMNESTLYLSATEATLSLRATAGAGRLGRGADLGTPRNARSPQATEHFPETRRDRAAPRPPAATVRMQLIGANRRARVVGEEQLPTRTSYFIGKGASHWQSDVANYERVRVEQVYRGIDIVYYGSAQHQLEYDFKVAPGADFRAIWLRFAGARSIRVDELGDLLIATPDGTLRHRKPAVYQEVNGVRKAIVARYVVDGRCCAAFAIESYDKRLPLVIDPVLNYSTYFGSPSGGEFVQDSHRSPTAIGTLCWRLRWSSQDN
jgi:hypothetical protein